MASEDLYNLAKQAVQEGINKLVVGMVLHKDNRILLLQRRSDDTFPDQFELPGGTVEPEENLPEAIERELFEETGIKLSSIRSYLGYFDYRFGGKLNRQFNFVVDSSDKSITQYPEHQSYIWADQSTLSKLPMTPEMYGVVSSAFGSIMK